MFCRLFAIAIPRVAPWAGECRPFGAILFLQMFTIKSYSKPIFVVMFTIKCYGKPIFVAMFTIKCYGKPISVAAFTIKCYGKYNAAFCRARRAVSAAAQAVS